MALVSLVIYGVLLIAVVFIVAMLSMGGNNNTSVSSENSFYSENEAIKILGISKEALKTMVSEEILRKYNNDGNTVFRKEDIEELSRNHKN
ncbi:helix-turn-helix domain-containing protein [Candidatus Uabimicrobium sp. HlEnr_7]|uniref:helix-turn-helix domain-containing protein n=1 Tax=Candidatus Uabimicrobium helgolandensis TaxID=3095367 RepID=UPI003558C646